MLALNTFGELVVRSDVAAIKLPLKVRVLLAIICDAPARTIEKRAAQTILWPDAPEYRAQHSLDQATYTLRRSCRPLVIDADSAQLTLRSAIRVDFLELKTSLAKNDILTALSFLKGEFLEAAKGLSGDEFEDWRNERHAYYMHASRTKLTLAIAAARKTRNAHVLAQLAEEGRRVFPEDGIYSQALIESQLMMGRRENAYHIWEETQARLGEERGEDFETTWSHLITQTSSDLRGSSPFVGRTVELATIQTAWTDCARGALQTVVVRGTAGMGKTSLCDEFLRGIQKDQIVHAPAHKGEEHIAFNVLATAMQTSFGRSNAAQRLPTALLAALIDTFPELHHDDSVAATPLIYEAAQRRVYEAAARVIAHLSEVNPVVMFFDDVHWADEASLEWIAYAARRLIDCRVLILCATRPGAEAKQATNALIGHLTRQAAVVDINELTEADVHQLVRVARPDLRVQTVVDDLIRRTGGHPLLLSAALQLGNDGKKLASSPEVQYLGAELASLPRIARSAVEFLSAIAAPTPLTSLTELMQITGHAMLDVVEQIAFLCKVSNNEINFKHDLMREGVYSLIPQQRIQLLHGEIAEHYERQHDAAGLITRHYWEAGRTADAARFVVQAAATCELRHAYSEADHFYRLAAKAVAEPIEKRRIIERHAEMLFRAGQHRSAAPLFQKLLDQYEGGANHERVRWRSRYLDACWSARLLPSADIRSQVTELRALAELTEDDEAYLVASKVLLAMPYSTDQQYDITGMRNELVRFGERSPVTRLGVGALCHAGRVFTLEDASTAVHYLRIAADWADQLREIDLQVMTGRSLATALYDSGQFEECGALLRKVTRSIEQHGAAYYLPELAEPLASLLVELEDPEQARPWVTIGLSEFLPVRYLFAAVANAALLEYHVGDFIGCVSRCDEFPAEYANVTWHEIMVRGLRGLSLIELGRIEEARHDARRVEDLLKSFEGRFGEVSHGLLLVARIAGFDSDQARVRPLIEKTLAAFEKRDFVCRQRLRLALAEVLPQAEARRAMDMCSDVIEIADDNQLAPLGKLARSVQRRVRRRFSSVLPRM